MSKAFDPDVLGEIVQDCVGRGLPHDQMLDAMTEEIDSRHPKRRIRKKRRWSWSNAGGAMLQISFLYGSLSEYLLFAHTPIGTEGHSGIYQAGLWDWVLDGEMWRYGLGDDERTVYKTGDVALLKKRGGGDGFCVKDHVTLLEYARGCIPMMMPFGLADSVFSTLDFKSIRHQLWDYGRICTRELLRGKI
jgi:hypothetical protein